MNAPSNEILQRKSTNDDAQFRSDQNSFLDDSKSFENFSGAQIVDKPNFLMWGLTKAGKTSIIKLIFEKITPNETLTLSETKFARIHDLTCAAHLHFQLVDLPGPKTAELEEFSTYATKATSIIFVIDVTEDLDESVDLLINSIQWTCLRDRHVRFEVLLHKADSLNENDQLENYSLIEQKVSVMLKECSIDQPVINFYLTSIYDHSIHEAFSKIVQNQIKSLRLLENMLDLVTSTTQLDKIFVCDISNKICVASDSKPIERQLSQLCCDVVDVYTDISSIYGNDSTQILDSMSFCTVRLSIGLVLYLKDINPTTALICILKKESKINEALIEVNLNILKKNIEHIFQLHSYSI